MVTGGALVRLMAVIWVVVVIAVVVVVVVLVGGAFSDTSMTTRGLSGLSGRVGCPRDGGGDILPVVLEGGLAGRLLGTGAELLSPGEGVLLAVDFLSAMTVGERTRGGVGPPAGPLGLCPG